MSSHIFLFAAALVFMPVSTTVDVKEAQIKSTAIQHIDTHKLISQSKYEGMDPHGADPHGDDPRDEQHDQRLPANQDRNIGKAPRDNYGGNVPNSQQPY